ncbi:MAG: SDR family oxidoreductase [Clostridiales bacterium]|jgi:NAD(P)-dependent dehydrogenase (short-subunit alcohol dehydrogenase family)|nr:SDR family oxidoreductase [Clostridiales bacterium]
METNRMAKAENSAAAGNITGGANSAPCGTAGGAGGIAARGAAPCAGAAPKAAGAGATERPVAFVTGSSRGIGAGIALEFARAGYDLALNYASSKAEAFSVKEKAEALGARAAVIQGDISSLADIDHMFAEFLAAYGRLDAMVNNAGITRFSPFLETTPELFESLINTDFRGAFFCSQKAARIMVGNGAPGTIINITSNHQSGCWPCANVYGPMKAALNKLTQNAAMELAPHGIRVVSIAPGYTRTRELSPEYAERRAALFKKLPLGRMCEPSEIGKACVFLAGDGAGYITGTCLVMDGGALLPVVADNTYTG